MRPEDTAHDESRDRLAQMRGMYADGRALLHGTVSVRDSVPVVRARLGACVCPDPAPESGPGHGARPGRAWSIYGPVASVIKGVPDDER